MVTARKEIELLTVSEVAQLLRCSVRHVQRKLKSGDLEGRKDGRRTLVLRWSVEAYQAAMPRRVV